MSRSERSTTRSSQAEFAVRALDVVGQTFAARFDKEFVDASAEEVEGFLFELLDFQRMQANDKKTTVSPVGIRNWLLGRGNPPKRSRLKRKDACEFMYQYIVWIGSMGRVSRRSREIYAKLRADLEDFIGIRPDNKTLTNTPDDLLNKFIIGDETVLFAVKAIVSTSSRNKRSERDDLFQGSPSNYELEDQSYYLMYRFSTTDEEIVKSLIQINTPEKGSDTYSFNHFIWHRRDYSRSDQPVVFRECEGVIAKFETSYYLIGYNFSVPVDRRVYPTRYYELRDEKRGKPNGIGIISFEYEAIRQNPGLLSGVTMTLGANDQPIIGRVALLHLCTHSGSNRRISDETVLPGGIKVDKLAKDIKQTVSRLSKAGVKRFSEYLETAISEDQKNGTGSQRVANNIVRLIDNTPAWESIKPSKTPIKCYGAIETVGSPVRPRD